MRTYEITAVCTRVCVIKADNMDEAMDTAYNDLNEAYKNLSFDIENAELISNESGTRIYRDPMDYYPDVKAV